MKWRRPHEFRQRCKNTELGTSFIPDPIFPNVMFVAMRAKQKQEKSQRKSRVFPFTSYFLCPTVSPTRIKQLRKTKMFTKLNLILVCGEQDRASPSVNQNHHQGCPETKQFRDHGAQPNPFVTFLWGVCTYVCVLRNNLLQFLKKKQKRKKKNITT